jgi:hypothetical protein
MSAKKSLNIQPIALTTSIANLLNCNIASLTGPVGYTQNQPYLLITSVRAMNKTGAPVNCTCYKGGTGGAVAGTEVFFAATSIPANDFLDWNGEERLDAADFLTGIAGANTAIVLTITAEIGISG